MDRMQSGKFERNKALLRILLKFFHGLSAVPAVIAVAKFFHP